MSENRLADYLDHMQEAAADALSFANGLGKDAFLTDKRTQQAIIMSLIIIGEAATKVMDRYSEFAESQPRIPWRSIAECATASPMATSKSTSMWFGTQYRTHCRNC